ncbi:MAG: hypothetical protein FJ104_03495 [Deltaproteobacteria bacterium]|nr:hypothetical protein [Deltaproteobacteria bacterium]
MRLHPWIKALGLVPLSVGLLGSAGAAPDDAPKKQFDFGGTRASASREINLPPDQQLAQSRSIVGAIEQNVAAVRVQLAAAREVRDVVKVLCLNDKRNQLNIVWRASVERLQSIQAAVTGNDRDRARTEYMLMLELRDRAAALAKEANQCIGEEAGFVGDTDVRVDVDSNIPNNDPGQLGVDPEEITPVPILTSPVL